MSGRAGGKGVAGPARHAVERTYPVAKKASSRRNETGKSATAAGTLKKSRKSTAAKSAGKVTKRVAGKAVTKPNDDTKKKPDKKPRKIKCPLTKREIKQFRQMLLDKRRELVGDMSGIEAEALGSDRQEVKGDISDHPADAGTDNFEQEFSLGLLESERILLAEIDGALRRIEEGSYGICLGTDQPISKARLKARPWAEYSIEYARMVEKGLVRRGERIVEDDEE